MTDKQLIKEAIKARNNSYSPYSGYKVGAAVLTKSGKVFYGTNVENCSYGATICAERSALVGATSHGEKDIVALALVGSSTDIAYPCGLCRQVILELAPNAKLICAKDEEIYEILTIADLLPKSFSPKDLEGVKKM